jgi:hypothetical protein
MKRRSKIIGALFAAALMLFTVIWWARSRHGEQYLPDPISASTDEVTAPEQKQPPIAAQREIPTTNREDISVRQAKALQDLQQKLDRSQDEWRTPIEFYGKVVDENDHPVVGAQVNFGCNDLSSDGTSYYTAQSDGQGMFSITGIKGKLLTARVSKEGYYSSKRDNDSFYYAGQNQNFVPDARNPVVFHLRTKGNAEPLLTWAQSGPRPAISFAVARDGTPMGISFQAARRVNPSEADLVVRCWTDDQGKPRGQKYDWRCQLTIPGGGLQELTEEFPFLAPETGYQASVEIDMPASLGKDWLDDLTRHYYVKLRNGTYGRLKFGMVAGGDHFCLVEPYVNPSGSRNLEFDPKNVIRPGQ